MDIRKLNDLLTRIELETQRLNDHLGHIRSFVAAIREEINPPADPGAPRTRDQIPPREWELFEWHDVTTTGDSQRKYIRGLRR